MANRIYNNCPECNYSAYPNEIIGTERKHHWPHSLECVRCGYRTETKKNWAEAKAAWNAPRATSPAATLAAAEDECWSIECHSYPTGGGDAEVGWEVMSHWQAEPQKRVEGRGKTPLDALRDAMNKGEEKRMFEAQRIING